MRWSLTTSVLMHAAILAAALVVLPNPDAFKVAPEDPIPVDIVSIEDFSKRQATAKVAEPPKPEEKVAPKKQEVVKDVKPAPEIAPEVKTAAKEPKAEPPPEPKKEEPKKEEPKPEEAKPLDPDPLKELIKDMAEETPEPKKEEPKKEEPKKAEVKPKVKPKPEKKKPEKKLDVSEIENFLNKIDDTKTAPQKPTTEEGSPKQGEFNMAGTDDGMSATIVDALQKRFKECWTPPAGARESNVSVKVRFRLNSDGSVAGIPEVVNSSGDPLFPSTAQSAVSAVQGCGPYDFLPADRYDLWQDNSFEFSPNMMFGI
jgi:outer membrane biosynthesis protein TonB